LGLLVGPPDWASGLGLLVGPPGWASGLGLLVGLWARVLDVFLLICQEEIILEIENIYCIFGFSNIFYDNLSSMNI